MNDLGNVLVGISLGVIIGGALIFLYISWKIRQISGSLDAMIRETIKEVESNMIGITVEKQDGIFYAYRESDKQFIAQASTVDELRAAFKKALPDKITYLAGGDAEAVKEVKEALEASSK